MLEDEHVLVYGLQMAVMTKALYNVGFIFDPNVSIK